MKGQALVEFALTLPLLMFMLLGLAEAAMLFAHRQGYQNSADVLAQWAAEEMSSNPGESWKAGWNQTIDEELDRTGCVLDGGVTVAFPDGTHENGDRVIVSMRCTYQPVLTAELFDLTLELQSGAVVPGAKPSPSPSASP